MAVPPSKGSTKSGRARGSRTTPNQTATIVIAVTTAATQPIDQSRLSVSLRE